MGAQGIDELDQRMRRIPDATPDQWARARAVVAAEAPELADMLGMGES